MLRMMLALACYAAVTVPFTAGSQTLDGQECHKTDTGCTCTDGQHETDMSPQDVTMLLSTMHDTASGDPDEKAQEAKLRAQCGVPDPNDDDGPGQ